MTARLAALTARRRDLQAECELQRSDVRQIYAGIERRTARVDHAIATARTLAPVIAVGGTLVAVVLGPRRVLGLLRRGLTIALYASQARHALLG